MSTRLSLFSALAFFCLCSNAMAVTGATTFVVSDGVFGEVSGSGFGIDLCGGLIDFGSVATPVLSDGKKVCALTEQDMGPLQDDLLTVVIDGFTSDPGINYFNTLAVSGVSCGLSLPAASGYYSYLPSTGQASWTFDIYATICLAGAGYTQSLSIN